MASSIWNRIAPKRDLWAQFTLRAIEMRHRGSTLGFTWSVLNPLLQAGVYVVVFGLIFNGRFNAVPDETGIDFALGVFLGLILFHVVAETISGAPTFIISQPNLVKKVVFPLELLPLSQTSASWFHAMISLSLCLLAQMIIGRGLSTGLVWLPVILLPHLLLTFGLSWLLASLGVFFRDIVQVVQLLTQILLWSSAVFFPTALIQKSPLAWDFLKWNPVLHTLDLARQSVLWHQPLNLTHLTYTWVTGLCMFTVGLVCFRATKRSFAEVI